jgi:hypothetical protein
MPRAKPAGTALVAEQGAIVIADGDDVVGALAANALGDDGERSGFDVEQIEAALAGGLQNAELRFVARADRQRAQRPRQGSDRMSTRSRRARWCAMSTLLLLQRDQILSATNSCERAAGTPRRARQARHHQYPSSTKLT